MQQLAAFLLVPSTMILLLLVFVFSFLFLDWHPRRARVLLPTGQKSEDEKGARERSHTAAARLGEERQTATRQSKVRRAVAGRREREREREREGE